MDCSVSIDSLLSRLDKVRSNGSEQWIACCPAHNDRSPSLSVSIGDDGRILLKCFAGCTIEDITSSMGIALCDLFPNKGIVRARRKFSIRDVEKALFHEMDVLRIGINMRRKKVPIHPDDVGREALAVKRIYKLLRDLYRGKTK